MDLNEKYKELINKKSVSIKLNDSLKEKLKEIINDINEYDFIKIKFCRTFFKQKKYYKVLGRKKFGLYKTILFANSDSFLFEKDIKRLVILIFDIYDINCNSLFHAEKNRYGFNILITLVITMLLIGVSIGLEALAYVFKGYFLSIGFSLSY